MDNTTDRGFKGVWIPAHIWLSPDLSVLEKCLLVEIDSLDRENGCFASNQHFVDFLGVQERQIRTYIARLEDKGYISSVVSEGNQRTIRVAENCRAPGRKLPPPPGRKLPHSNTIKSNTITNSKELGVPPYHSGNPYINSLMQELRQLNNNFIDGSEKDNRRYCWLLLGKLGYKKDPDVAANTLRQILSIAKRSQFHSKNATSFKYLYYNGSKIIQELKAAKPSVAKVL